MTTSDTPETDAAVISSNGQWSFVLKETCRRIERERDEARKKYDTLATEHMLEVNKLCKERDEAMKELEEYRSIAENIGAKKAVSEKEQAIRERNEATEELAEAKREAENLAKSIYQSEYSDNDTDWELLDRVLKAIRERDEACQVQNGLAKQVERLRKERDQLKEALLIMENLLKPGIELFPEIGEILKQGGAK